MEEEFIPFAVIGIVLTTIILLFAGYLKLMESKYNIERRLKEEIKKELKNEKEEDQKEITGRAIIEDDEFDLICRALSDSMNYKPNDRWNEKWDLLIKLKTIKHLAEKESEV